MDAPRLIDALDRFADVLPVVVAGVAPDDARWRGPGEAWSLLEIVTHVADEEEADFRPRLEATLRDPTADWMPIDPEGWAAERRYNDGDLADALARFVRERRASIVWLRSLEAPDWSLTHEHPTLPPISAGDLLASWAAHDALHLRQIAKRMHQLIARDAGECSPAYAGRW